jgi:hypothetical protein
MTISPALVRFRRSGGISPRDDERLDVASDGSFEAHRTVGGARIGTFAGQLASATLRRLQADVAAIRDATDLEIATPRDGATEYVEAGGRTARIGSNERPTGSWKALIGRLRRLLEDDVVEAPNAAIELTASPTAASLRHAGSEPLDVDLASAVIRVVRLADDGRVLDRWGHDPQAAVVEDSLEAAGARHAPDWTRAGIGWSRDLPFGHSLEMAAADTLQVWVEVAIRDAAGTRHGQLYVPVQSGKGR